MLYHFSEEPGIERFVPRPVERYPQMLPVVIFHGLFWLPGSDG